MTNPTLEQELKTLASETRLVILAYLRKKKSATVGAIAKAIGKSQNTISFHLAELTALSMLVRVRRGHFVTYRIALKQSPLLKLVLRELGGAGVS